MADELAELREENQRLQEQLSRLRREKADLQMAVQLVNQIAGTMGVVNVVDHILQILMGAIGGSNIAIYYATEERWRYSDTLGRRAWMDSIDDPLVRRAVEKKAFLKAAETEDANVFIQGYADSYETWVYPLQVHGSFFGAVRLQGMAIEHAHYRGNIDPFIQYSALVLYHEVSSIRKLTQAYQKVEAARREAEQSRERFELAMQFANEGLFDWDLKENTIYFSPVWKSMLGYEDHEVENEFSEWERLTKPADVKAAWAMINEVLAGKRPRFEMEFQMRHKRGHWVDILARANVIFNEKGEGRRVVGTHVDITRLRQMENEVRESEIKYRSIMEATKDPTYICSEKFHIEYMNPAMVQWVGRDATGEICHRAIHGKAEKCRWCPFEDVLKKVSISREFVCARDQRTYLSSNAPIEHMDGSVSKLTVYHDVTDFMNMKARLQQAQKMESIGNLAGGIAHDFNNILFPIIGMSELLLSDLDAGSDVYENVREIMTAGRRGGDLVRQILTFSRQSEQKKLSIRVQQILKEVLKLCRATIPSDIEIHQEISQTCGKVFADPTQIHQVALNLMTNAYHAVEKSGGEISVSLAETVLTGAEIPSGDIKPGPYALLRVSDNGIGMEKALLDKIFEPYFTTKTQGKGTGLGLATAYGIVKEHKGDIRVYTEPGMGTTFNVYLPISARGKAPAADNREKKTYPRGDETVLVVDDEPAVVKLEAMMLARLGYRVVSFTSSIEALAAFQAEPETFDIVVTDMTMPEMTGDTLATEMISIKPEIPIVICTGFSERLNQDKSQSMGIKAFLMKPVGMKEISHTVRNLLDGITHP